MPKIEKQVFVRMLVVKCSHCLVNSFIVLLNELSETKYTHVESVCGKVPGRALIITNERQFLLNVYHGLQTITIDLKLTRND